MRKSVTPGQSLGLTNEQSIPPGRETLGPEATGEITAHALHPSTLPVHPVPPRFVAPLTLRVDGLVLRTLDLRPADLLALPQQKLVGDFTCVEGWTAPQLSWDGVPLQEVLDLAGVRAEARWLQANAGPFSVPLPDEVWGTAFLALRLGGEELSVEHGGPVRLVVPGQACYTSVKWLDHIELRAMAATNTAEEIARRRLTRTP